MTARPDRLLIVFADALRNRPAAASYQTLVDIGDGQDIEKLMPIDAAQLSELLPLFNASLIVERDSLNQQLASLATLQAERDTLSAEVEQLRVEVDALRNPPRPQEVTPAQLRVWLIQHAGPDVLAQIDTMINQIDDPATREIARVKWEYGVAVLRTDPLLAQFGQALGFTSEQMDQAFAEASQL